MRRPGWSVKSLLIGLRLDLQPYSGSLGHFFGSTLLRLGLLSWKGPCPESPNGHHTDAWSQGLEPCGACGEPLRKS